MADLADRLNSALADRYAIQRKLGAPPLIARSLACVALIASLPWWRPALVHAAPQPELRWGGDAEGGAPYVEADPADPSRVVGFDVEIARLLATGLGRTP